MEFSKWLQQKINQQGWSQTDFVLEMANHGQGISQSHLSRILKGLTMPSAEVCVGLAQTLGISREEIFRQRGWLLPEKEGEMRYEVARLAKKINELPEEERWIVLQATEGLVGAFTERLRLSKSD